jgi:hypothetical protein
MPDYSKLRSMVSHRVTFEFDTGAKIVGYLAGCKPASGQVQIVNMTSCDLLDATGRVMEHHAEFSFVPNALVGVRVTEGPSERG